MATNYEMIEEYANVIGFEFDGDNLKTFAEWKKAGFTVKKGQKAFMQLELWKPFIKTLDEKDEKGKDKTETRFKLQMSSLFTPEQVEKSVAKKKPATKKAGSKKKKQKHTFINVTKQPQEQLALSI